MPNDIAAGIPLGTGHKLNVHWNFNLRFVSREITGLTISFLELEIMV